MGHCITAIIIKEKYSVEKAQEYDLRGISLGHNLTMFIIDIYYITYWQHALGLEKHLSISPPHDMLVPTEEAIAHLVKEIASPQTEYILISTDYAGGIGKQYAAILQDLKPSISTIQSINDALKHIGIIAREGLDEFDTINLSKYRSTPPYLNKYADLCDELGL